MKHVRFVIAAVVSLIGTPVLAADLPVKAPSSPPLSAAPSWTGFYIGGQVGGAWAHRSVTYTANDPIAALLVNGTLTGTGQPFAPNKFDMSGVVGGIELGYNWQFNRNWLLGFETDFSGSSLKGTGNSTSVFATVPAIFNNSLTEKQSIDWYGTVRGRLGWLPSDNLLLFATGGLAYGHVANSGSYTAVGIAGLPFAVGLNGFSFVCFTDATCFSGSSSSVRTGWTVGGGVEWLVWQRWSIKVEYQYVDLGSEPLRMSATAVFPGFAPASFNVNFGRDDFHVVRAGLNYHF
ncbi:MAG TPA: outer membrane beta-barrel protein [Pseudolabrys sp.]|nr:outer membrane beta-barrel protein [Pseudolabrys sp.]